MNQLARWTFDRPGDLQRYCTKQFPIEDKERVRVRLPADAVNVYLIVDHPIDGRRERELNPSAFPECDRKGELTERGRQEVEEIKQQAITQHANEELDAYRARLIVLTNGCRGSLRKRELDIHEAAARAWAETAGECEIAEAREQAARILTTKFANVQTPGDLVSAVTSEKAPADYDDSEQALGRQRAAQLERLEQAERLRSAKEADERQPAEPFADF